MACRNCGWSTPRKGVYEVVVKAVVCEVDLRPSGVVGDVCSSNCARNLFCRERLEDVHPADIETVLTRFTESR